MLTRETVVDKIEVLERGHIQVRRAEYIVENGRRLGHVLYHRAAYDPGASVTAEDARVQAIAAVVWTPGVIAEYRATQPTR